MFVNNLASEKIIPVEVANKVWRLLGNFKEFFLFCNLCIFSMALYEIERQLYFAYITLS